MPTHLRDMPDRHRKVGIAENGSLNHLGSRNVSGESSVRAIAVCTSTIRRRIQPNSRYVESRPIAQTALSVSNLIRSGFQRSDSFSARGGLRHVSPPFNTKSSREY
ncbi:hypothetical protein N7530_009917 [Penicillium desertorum]|uniref:Uncharacterized protein n=1 Tax=Penicillium desertorum TaxID=1303715 RepID=A0A9W9WJJ2_9EURO|nr:hypothetical protein N7530_009917 [Penicillium desertorum]